MTKKKIIIFGASGSLGKVIVEQALEKRHTVTAFTRTPSNMTLQSSTLRVVQGDVLDQQQVNNAIDGHDVVLCALGAGRAGTLRHVGTQHIISAMQMHSVERLICQTTLGAGDSYPNLNFFWKHIMFGLLLRPAFADHQQQEQAIIRSELNWTIVRPAAFTDGPLTKNYRHGFDGTAQDLKLKISRHDVTDFIVNQQIQT